MSRGNGNAGQRSIAPIESESTVKGEVQLAVARDVRFALAEIERRHDVSLGKWRVRVTPRPAEEAKGRRVLRTR